MEMNNLYITCKNIKQRQDVFDVLTGLGYSNFGNNGGILNIQTDSSAKDFSTWTLSAKLHGTTDLTYQEFMDKYSMNQLKTKIDEVKAKLGLTQMQLSERIGKNPYYLDAVKHRGVTAERQNELIKELDFVSDGGVLVTEREIIKTLTERMDRYFGELESAKENLSKSQEANRELSKKLDFAEKQHMELNNAYGRVCEKLAEVNRDMLIHKKYKRQYCDLVATVLVIGIIIILGFVIWAVV